MTLATAILVVACQHRLVIIAAIRRPAVDEMSVGHHPHHATLVGTRLPAAGEMSVGHHPQHVTLVGTRLPTAGVMTAGRHPHHLAFAGMTIDAMMIDVAAIVEIVVSPLRDIVDAATRFRGVHLVLVDVTSVSVHPRHVGRAVESGTTTATAIRTAHVHAPVILTAKEIIRKRDTGIADVDTNDHVLGHLPFVSTLFRLCDMFRGYC
jgi:hypothetical protein